VSSRFISSGLRGSGAVVMSVKIHETGDRERALHFRFHGQ
jgi:hypothetical protein